MKKQSKSQQQSSDPADLFSRAVSLFRAGNANEAEAIGRKLLVSYPKNADLLNLLGIIQTQRNNFEEAARFFEKIVAITPGNGVAYRNLGHALSYLSKFNEALAVYDKALAMGCGDSEIYHNRGIALYAFRKYDDALASCDKAITLDPRNAEAYSTRAAILQDQKRYSEALASCDKAIAINPNYAMAHNNRGLALNSLKQYDEALASYDKAIAINPCLAIAYNNRGLLLLNEMKRYSDALASYEKAIAMRPDFANAYWNKSLFKLLQGDFEEGWKLYEWRWKRDDIDKKAIRTFQQPLWLGEESLTDKTILLHAEQGLGDTIQFCRYAPLVQNLGAKVILEVQKPLVGLVSTLKGSFTIVAQDSELSAFDFHCPLMSLPLAFKTTLENIPANVPYLSTDPEKLRTWQKRLGEKSKTRIGLVWSGAPIHKRDHSRSIPLNVLAPLLQLDCEYHSLQKEVREQDVEFLAGNHIVSHADHLQDFTDTAALVSEMDVIISVDTSIAHLAGALGKPIWVLLPLVPDFRWLTEREDSPWYPSARLFRQPRLNDWDSVIAKLMTELTVLISSK